VLEVGQFQEDKRDEVHGIKKAKALVTRKSVLKLSGHGKLGQLSKDR
jgi:hypothetical protein